MDTNIEPVPLLSVEHPEPGINFNDAPEEEFQITVKKLVLPVRPRGVLAE